MFPIQNIKHYFSICKKSVSSVFLFVMVTLTLILNIPNGYAGEIFTKFPDPVNPQGKYVFYSHGFIVEGTNPTPKHPRFGVYQFPDIKKALAGSDFNLIAYHRPAQTKVGEFSRKLADDVRRLIADGVDPANITLMGFSKGGIITAFTASNLSLRKINVILLASCGGWIDSQPDIMLAGNILSIYETSDRFGSCQTLINRSKKVTSFKEIAISTGKEHGAFFTPRKEWVEPVLNWINSRP
ncbi:hypothetical protein MNBD_ALPHA02-1244 [hydrothermal vent metagenome]|uniref:Alpha/beta hydrolase n=1 Tax=hydrothermal vent metagenome TaxID=652676 RepID=A0A3B0SDP3_9ZZZZ